MDQPTTTTRRVLMDEVAPLPTADDRTGIFLNAVRGQASAVVVTFKTGEAARRFFERLQ